MHYKEIEYGFEYGDAKVTRLFSDEKKGWVTLAIESSKFPGHKAIKVYVTKTGKVRIHSSDGEWFPHNPEINVSSDVKIHSITMPWRSTVL